MERALRQISGNIFCDDFLDDCHIETKLFPSPYRELPYLLIENFLDTKICDTIAADVRQSNDAQMAMLKTTLLESVVDPSVDESIRKTHIHTLKKRHAALYREAFITHQAEIERFFNVALTTATDIQVLEYQKGFFYKRHADDSSELVNDEGKLVGFIPVAPQRKITTVLFATSHGNPEANPHGFNGGELVFNYLFDAEGTQVTIQPKAGQMVVFPSNPFFSHEVLPVTDGYRLTLVQWHNAIIH